MTQAFINQTLDKAEIEELRKKLSEQDFSDCDEELLVQAAIEVEKRFNKKRKQNVSNGIVNKKKKLENKHVCDFCDKVYKHQKTLNRHIMTHFSSFICKKCGKSFTRKYNWKKHEEKCSGKGKHTKNKVPTCKHSALPQHVVDMHPLNPTCSRANAHVCRHCGVPFENIDSLLEHVANNHPLNQSSHDYHHRGNQTGGDLPAIPPKTEAKKERFKFKKSAINNNVNRVDIIPDGDEKYDLIQFLANVKNDVEKELITQRKKHRNIKWYVNARVEMIRDLEDENKEKAHPHFRSKAYISLADENNDHNINEAFQSVNKAMEEFINKGSNWILNKVICLEVHTFQYSPISGSSYMELPHKIKFSKCVINIKNDDQKCFLWSVLAALHPVQNNANLVHHYKKYEHDLNMSDIEYPVLLPKMEKFEKQNKISVNVFGFEDGEVFPLYLSKLQNGFKEVDLLYLSNEEQSHYCWIKNLDRFLGSTTRYHTKRFYCRRCLHGFVRKDLLNEHRHYCNKFDFQKVTYPKEGENDILEFKDFHKQMRVPFVIYADFECFTTKIDTCLPNPEQSSTTHTTKFEACGYSYVVVSSNDKYSKPAVVYRGENAIEHFFENMFREEEYIEDILRNPEELVMNAETEKQFQNASNCYVCQKPFINEMTKVRDHDHLGVNTDSESQNYSNYRGAACQKCNLCLQNPPFIPVYFHNLRNFDGHLLLTTAGKYKDRKLSCIPNNMEKYISFSVGKLRFLDSYQCMQSSLETLVENLANDGLTHFKQFRKAFPDDDVAKLLLQKNEYCYDYVDCAEKFNDTQLPSKQAFYNSLTKEHISEEKYNHAQTVWNTFNMNNLGQFHDLYVLTDVLLLADVFERFRDMTLKYYKLDASHFYTCPGLAWQAALKMSGVCLDLITDPLMYNLIELGTRGGISVVTKKYSRANHKLLKTFDETKPSIHNLYLDAGNLYGWSMCQPLPHGFLHFLSEEEIEKFDLQKIKPDANEGYILEVDLEYPAHLHDLHNCYPLAPEHQLIEDKDLSPYSKRLWTKLNGDNHSRIKTKKLIPNLKHKDKYIVHYRNLQLYVELGMKITKIHRILGFHQKAWLKSYIEFNANMRKQAKNEFEKDFFKLMCNRYEQFQNFHLNLICHNHIFIV